MRSSSRRPESLSITIVKGLSVADTRIEVVHREEGLSVVVIDEPMRCTPEVARELAGRAAEVWMRTGPLAAHAALVWTLQPSRPRRHP